jgi:HlyD family secretion protein
VGFVAGARLDAVRLALAGAQRELEVAIAEHDVATHEQQQAAAVLQPVTGAGAKAGSLKVRSPVAGVVLRVAQPSEATLAAGTALLDVGDPRQMEVVSELLTTDAVQAQPGRRVVIERWGGSAVEGRVRRVEPAAFTKVSALGVEEQASTRSSTSPARRKPGRRWATVFAWSCGDHRQRDGRCWCRGAFSNGQGGTR